MAKAKFGNIIVDMRGKVNGNVYSKNKYGAYTRVKVSPTNPRTAAQMDVRSTFTTNSQAWRGLTEAQRQSFIAGAINFTQTNVFGDSHHLTGSALYNRLNNNLANIGEALIDSCPMPVAVPTVVGVAIVADNSAQSLTLSYTGSTDANVKHKIFATTSLSAGVNTAGSKLRQIGVLDESTASPSVQSANYIAKFGNIGAVGTKIFLKIVPVDMTTGIEGAATVVSTVVVA